MFSISASQVFNLVLLFTSAVALVLSLQLPELIDSDTLSPAAFPSLISGAILALSALLVIREARLKAPREGSIDTSAPRTKALAFFCVQVALLVGYLLTFELLGYWLSTSVFMALYVLSLRGFSTRLEEKPGLRSALVTGTAIAIYVTAMTYVFGDIFQVALPGLPLLASF